jgi:hypothetical protein
MFFALRFSRATAEYSGVRVAFYIANALTAFWSFGMRIHKGDALEFVMLEA